MIYERLLFRLACFPGSLQGEGQGMQAENLEKITNMFFYIKYSNLAYGCQKQEHSG